MMIKRGVYAVLILMVLLTIVISSTASAGILDWFKQTITGRASTTQPTNVSISVVGVNPVTIDVWNETLGAAATTPTEYSSVTIDINITVTDPDGYADINDSSVAAYLINDTSAVAIRGNDTCAYVSQYTTNSKNYTCSIDMWYWDITEAWIINISANDLGNTTYISNETNTLFYSQLQAIQIAPLALTWPSVAPGNDNQSSNNDPTLINNTGNYNVTSGNFKITGINLYGPSGGFIDVGNFSVNITSATECDPNSTLLSNGSAQAIEGGVLDFGNLSDTANGVAQTNIYYCLVKVPDTVISEAYSTETAGSDAWIISIT